MTENNKPVYGYIALYRGRQWELYAGSSYAAWQDAVKHFKAPKSRHHLVTVYLAEKDGETVTQTVS